VLPTVSPHSNRESALGGNALERDRNAPRQAFPARVLRNAPPAGRESDASRLIHATTEDFLPRGEGMGLTLAPWATAYLHNGLARYDVALAAAPRGARSHQPGDRRAAVHQPEHGRVPLAQGVPQARRQVAHAACAAPVVTRRQGGRAKIVSSGTACASLLRELIPSFVTTLRKWCWSFSLLGPRP